MRPIPLLIDTDPGVDDFFCLALACAYGDRLDLRAVTAMGGNHVTDVTTQNALDILSFFGKDVPVARGADHYLAAPFGPPAAQFHGENGLGNVTLPKSDKGPNSLSAPELIYETARQAAGALVIVPVAPLTNVATAIKRHPDLVGLVKKIVMMGGSLTRGNITPYAEANVGHDPEAAKIVFESGIPVDMVGLNVTSVCPIRRDVFDRAPKGMKAAYRAVMEALIAFRNGEALHDAVAIASLLDEGLLGWARGRLSVELLGARRGATALVADESASCRAAVTVDEAVYDRVILGMLERLAGK